MIGGHSVHHTFTKTYSTFTFARYYFYNPLTLAERFLLSDQTPEQDGERVDVKRQRSSVIDVGTLLGRDVSHSSTPLGTALRLRSRIMSPFCQAEVTDLTITT